MNDTVRFARIPDVAGTKAALVIPPSPFLLDERVFVSLGVLRVAASLESRGVKVGVLDLSGVGNYLEVMRAYLESNDVEWIGITSTTPQLPSAVKLAMVIRESAPALRLVLGGPHVTLSRGNDIVEGRKCLLTPEVRAQTCSS